VVGAFLLTRNSGSSRRTTPFELSQTFCMTSTDDAAASVSTPTQSMHLLNDEGMNYDLITTLGGAPYGLAEVGEVFAMVDAITAKGESYQAYVETFHAEAERLLRRARAAQKVGNTKGATSDALRASNYFQSALFFVLGTDKPGDEEKLYRSFVSAWELAAPNLAPVAEPLSIPYEGRTLPGWFFAPDATGAARRTLIMSNGSDGQYSWAWGFALAAALQYGWNAVVFEGPGQGSLLFVDKVPFRADWEAVITPVVDHLLTRSDVDGDRIALIGGSMSGQLVPRAASFEHRLAAIVAAPGVLSPWDAFPDIIHSVVTDDEESTNKNWNENMVPFLTGTYDFTMKKRLEIYDPEALKQVRVGKMPTDFWTPTRTLLAQDIRDVVHQISCPTLVVDYEEEGFYGGQAKELYDRLTCEKRFVRMTSADGAQLHCSPMAPQVHADVVLTWLDGVLGGGVAYHP